MEWVLGVDDLGVDASDHSSKREDRDTKQLQYAEDDSDDEEDQDGSPRSRAGDSSSPQDRPEDAYTDLREINMPPPSRNINPEMQRFLDQLERKQEIQTTINRDRKEENRRRKKHTRKQYKMHIEAVQNIRNTITVVAVLIATIAFTGAVAPPGSVYQDGPLIGKPILGRTTSYKVFIICNDIALFLCLSVVLMLISIIPFQSKPLKKLVFIAHKVVWVAVAFMSTAYIAARWATMYHGIDTRWMFAVLLSICGGLLILVFFVLSVMLVNDRLRKSDWKSRMETMKTVEQEDDKQEDDEQEDDKQEDDDYSIISDVESNLGRGYHSH